MNCTDFDLQIEEYVVGRLSPAERAAIDHHATICPPCGDSLRQAEEAAAFVRLSVPQIAPPQELRSRILSAARLATMDQPPAPAPRPVPTGTVHGPVSLPWWQRLRSLPIAAAISALSLLVALALVGRMVILQNDLTRLEAENARLAELSVRQEQLMTILASSASVERPLAGGDSVPKARGQLFYDPAKHRAVLLTSELPRPAADRSYQVWGRSRGGPVSLGLLRYDGTDVGYAVLESPMPIGQFEAVGVSLEPVGGSPQPTGPRMLFGSLL